MNLYHNTWLKILMIGMMVSMVVHVSGFVPMLRCEERDVKALETSIHESINTHQKSQQKLDEWEKERLKLQAKFDMLTKENEMLTAKVETLRAQEASQKILNEQLVRRDKESRRIAEEIGPYIQDIQGRIDALVASDLPFLENERKERLDRLNTVMGDMDVSVAEKFRKVMETLFVEAEYGNTIEVYQDKIMFGEEELLGNIFRLGRISLFFLSLDKKTAAYFNMGEKKWTVLNDRYVPAIHAAIEIGGKRRPTELLCLPVGRLAVQ
ncbi:MAG: DUF3450 domain-containing protein [Proteobacteria bacterium]|nr:DUF3450 domain-containing protein [Pseudomonadota bacterium]